MTILHPTQSKWTAVQNFSTGTNSWASSRTSRVGKHHGMVPGIYSHAGAAPAPISKHSQLTLLAQAPDIGERSTNDNNMLHIGCILIACGNMELTIPSQLMEPHSLLLLFTCTIAFDCTDSLLSSSCQVMQPRYYHGWGIYKRGKLRP